MIFLLILHFFFYIRVLTKFGYWIKKCMFIINQNSLILVNNKYFPKKFRLRKKTSIFLTICLDFSSVELTRTQYWYSWPFHMLLVWSNADTIPEMFTGNKSGYVNLRRFHIISISDSNLDVGLIIMDKIKRGW